ncbi:MAG: ATP-binding protein [Candidatus Nanoarchaeia archaeon]
MALGKITGKTTTNNFKFTVEQETKKFEYVQVHHKNYGKILCQIIEIERDEEKETAFCSVIGYKDEDKIRKPRIPFEISAEVELADDEFIKEIIKLESDESGAHIGKLDGKEINVLLDLNKILTMHLSVLAKSGAGKSYSVGVILEEMISKNIPLIVFDPHGEYSTLKFKNDNKDDLKKLKTHNLKPQAFPVQEFGDPTVIPGARPIRLNNSSNQEEFMHLLPNKLTNSQMALLYTSMKNTNSTDFAAIISALEAEESNAKWSVISMIEHLNSLNIFSDSPISYNEFLKPGCCSIINMKGINPDIQELIVYKICKDMFELRKKGKIPPFFMIIEEAHNYCPERSFGETKASKIIRSIASEGRKFGLGLCVISQRPARVDKSILSQCSTQFILKVTNPNDLKAITSSIEGITSSTEQEVQNLPIGTALITGLTEVPLFVNIRPRKSMHGGKSQKMIQSSNFIEKVTAFQEKQVLSIIKPTVFSKDLQAKKRTILVPCYNFVCTDNNVDFSLLIEAVNGGIVFDKDNFKTKLLPDLKILDDKKINVLRFAFKKNKFKEQDVLSSLGLNLSITEELKSLVRIGYLTKTADTYSLSDKYVFSKLSNQKNDYKIDAEEIQYDEKLTQKITLDEIIDKLRAFTNIKDRTECFLVLLED